MLHIDKQKIARMAANGKQILRSLQNTETNEIDLLVRESIQNSLDAGFEGKDIKIDFSIGDFVYSELFSLFEGTNNFKESISDNLNKYLVISDTFTVGLDGPLSHEDFTTLSKSRNLLKLVYDIGKPKSDKGAGGSWGYGKSIYYRVGIGFVVYYTRIKNDFGVYEERLAACLVEDQDNDNTLVQYDEDNRTGIVWWGEFTESFNSSTPITNNNDIEKVLDLFDIGRFKDEETGTKIIIPFIDEDKLFDSTKNGTSNQSTLYYDDLSDYIYYSVQRWYAPRLNNNNYIYGKGNNLIVSINNQLILKNGQVKYFSIIREMYNYAIGGNNKTLINLVDKEKIKRKEITITNNSKYDLSETKVGTFVYGMFSYKELGMQSMTDTDNPTFLSNLNNSDISNNINSNSPIILFTRQPGMIVNYVNKGEWFQSSNETSLDEYLIGFFVLSSDSETYFSTIEGKKTVEEYVRMSERSDHTEWYDSSFINLENIKIDPKIISKVRSNINRTLNDGYFKKSKATNKPTDISEFISSLFGEKLLPVGLGTGASKNKTSISRGSRKSNNGIKKIKNKYFSYHLDNKSIKFHNDQIEIKFSIEIMRTFRGAIAIELLLSRGSGKSTIYTYEGLMDRASEVSFAEIVDDSKLINATYFKTSSYETSFRVHLNLGFDILEEGEILSGTIIINSRDRSMLPILEASEVLYNE